MCNYSDVYEIEGHQIKFTICETLLTIYDSYLVREDKIKITFLKKLTQNYPFILKDRSIKSMLREWKSHNVLYKWKVRPINTKDTDLEYKQCLFCKIGYFILAWFKE